MTELTYDGRGRVTGMTVNGREGQSTTTFDVNPIGLIETTTLPNGVVLTNEWDAARRLMGVRDSKGNRIEYDRDAMGNITEQRTYDESGELFHAQRTAYDELGRVIQRIGAADQTQVSDLSPNGNAETVTDPNQSVWLNSFDELNRLSRAEDPEEGVIQMTHDQRGNLSTVTDQRGLVTRYEYNDFDVDLSVDGVAIPQDIRYDYDLADNLTRIHYASGMVLNYQRDIHGEVTDITLSHRQPNGDTTTSTVADQIEYQPFGGIRRLVYGNGLRMDRTFDQDGRLSRQSVEGVQDFELTYDPNGNITLIDHLIAANDDRGFAYDLLNRLREETRNDTVGAFTYDPVSNRLVQPIRTLMGTVDA